MLKNSKDNLKVLHPLPRVKEIDQDVDVTPKHIISNKQETACLTQAVICDLMRLVV